MRISIRSKAWKICQCTVMAKDDWWTMLSPYGVLRIQPGCNEEELRAAYKKRALETHPDKGGNVEEFRSVKTAYEALLKTVPSQPLSRASASNSSNSPETSVFTPFSKPFPEAFRAAAFKAAGGGSQPSQPSQPPRKRRRSLEETIELAFAGIPSMHRINRFPKAAPAAPKAKPVPSPKKSPVPSPKKSPRPETPERQNQASQGRDRSEAKTSPESPGDDFAAKLWARLLQLTLEKRSEAISSLPPKTKERLEAYLRAKRRQRSENGETNDSGESETSSESSSSSTEASSDTESAKTPSDPWTLRNTIFLFLFLFLFLQGRCT